ncbi:MAG: tRNA (N(6)-L-threonylcarbamoyladenosine(37)-C(2))-methylthiotransferase MtaB [Ruminococcaceae bacterium]|nr:tRNA (N(6)-L-threonylcarbamoyladenosine(37)-C(2))-methylthiotransferase MtaB [Oscillospiraceae bacterium]
MKRVAFCTLGCKVNQYETQAMCELFLNNGYTEVDFDEQADVYVINTCSVTSMSDRKSRQMIRRAKKRSKDAIVVVTGCYAQTAAKELAKIEDINLIIGTSGRSEIVSLTERVTSQSKHIAVGDIMHTHEFENLSVNSYSDRTRAYIKLQEGCSQFCSYCIIPYARGPIRSRSEDEVIEEAKRLCKNGFRELVLVGIHIASYGRDLKNDTSLEKIICKISELEDVKRIRLSSIEPMTLDENFIKAVSAAGDKLCHHFHISLQSGCDETLVRMNRKYLSVDFEKIVSGLREAIADCAITTDIMVGFAGETDEEFEQSLAFADKISFSDMHVFSYSPRPGTPAAKMDNQVSPEMRHERSARMLEVAEKNRDAFLDKFVGKTLEILFERECDDKKGFYEGKSQNYISVICKAGNDLSGQFLNVKLTHHKDGIMYGEIVL